MYLPKNRRGLEKNKNAPEYKAGIDLGYPCSLSIWQEQDEIEEVSISEKVKGKYCNTDIVVGVPTKLRSGRIILISNVERSPRNTGFNLYFQVVSEGLGMTMEELEVRLLISRNSLKKVQERLNRYEDMLIHAKQRLEAHGDHFITIVENPS